MALLENKIGSAILSAIRSRREETPASAISTANDSPARLRQAQFSDFAAVANLKNRWSMDADSAENWDRLWRRNPALADRPSAPIGWVLESQSQIVGYIGNIVLRSHYRGRTLFIAASHGLVVEPAYRAMGVTLISAFYRQKSIDLYVVTTAIPPVGKMARAFKSDAIPQTDYDNVLFWILRPAPFARSLLKKIGVKSWLTPVAGPAAALAVTIDRALERRRPRASASDLVVSEIGVSEIGCDFQQLWLDKLNENPGIIADRDVATLQWHYSVPGDRGATRVLCCRKNAKLLGYAVIRHEPADESNGLRKSIVVDMLVAADNAAVIEALMVACYRSAHSAQSHILELMGFPRAIREVCQRWRPYVRKYPACPYFYKAADAELHKALADPDAWYATPYDGDTTLIQPSYPTSPFREEMLQAETPAQSGISTELAKTPRTAVV